MIDETLAGFSDTATKSWGVQLYRDTVILDIERPRSQLDKRRGIPLLATALGSTTTKAATLLEIYQDPSLRERLSISPRNLSRSMSARSWERSALLDYVPYLINKGADLNRRLEDGSTILMHLGREYTEDDNDKYRLDGTLQYAAKLFRLSKRTIAGFKAKDNKDLTALHHAAIWGHPCVVKWLLSWDRVDVDESNNQGRTALFYAAQRHCSETVLALLSYKADLDLLERESEERHYVEKYRPVDTTSLDMIVFDIRKIGDITGIPTRMRP